MAASVHKKSGGGTKGHGGVTGAIVPPRKQVDNFPLMTFVAKNCSFDDDDSSLEKEEVLKVANDRRVEELLSKAALSVKSQVSQTASSSEEADRKNALEIIHSLEVARNLKDTWKVSEQNCQKKDSRNFLHPLKRNDKEDDYFSGIPKVKQAKERKRCRSDEVVLLENGRLVPKNCSVDYFNSNEGTQLPIKLNMPLRAKPPRVPSVGLPFTPGPPIPTDNNPWMQRSGSDLFSVQSHTLLVNGTEDSDLALAIAESIRTAKEEQQRNAKLETLYQSQCAALSPARFDKESAAPADSCKSSCKNNSWGENSTLTSKNRSMSMDRARWANWDKDMSKDHAKASAPDANNNRNLNESENAMSTNKRCLEQRPRHSKEQGTSKSPPPPMLADFEKSVSDQGTVITLQALDKKKYTSEIKQTEEKCSEITINKEKVPEKKATDSLEGREIELKQEKRIYKTSHVPETFDAPRITRLPTSKPTALMAAMKNFTHPTKDSHVSDNVEHSAKTTIRMTEVPQLPVALIGDKNGLSQPSDKKFKHNYVGHIPRTNESSPKVPPLLVPPKESVKEEEKTEAQETKGAESLNSAPQNTSQLPEISNNVAPPQSEPHRQQLPATPSASNPLEEMSMASAQAQLYQMLLNTMGCIPQVLQNGQNFGGVSGQLSNHEKKPEMGAAAPMSNTLPGGVPGFPNPPLGGMAAFPNGFPGMPIPASLNNPYPGIMPGLTNPFPGMPGLTNPYPGLANPLAGAIPGLGDPLSGSVPSVHTRPGSLPNPSGLPKTPPFAQRVGMSRYPGAPVSSNNTMPGLYGFQNAMSPGFHMNPLSSMQGLQSNLPGFQTPISASPSGIQNCNSFGEIAQNLLPKPGCAPLMGGRGRGRGRLSNNTAL